MANYTVSHKLPSMDSYQVLDDSGAQVYGAKHHTGLMHETWDITDAQGNSVATLTHERKHVHATFKLTSPGNPEVTFTKVNFMPVSETWEITGDVEDQKVTGDLANYDWSIQTAGGTTTATLQRKLVSMHRQYFVSVENQPLVAIAMAIALDVEHDEHHH